MEKANSYIVRHKDQLYLCYYYRNCLKKRVKWRLIDLLKDYKCFGQVVKYMKYVLKITTTGSGKTSEHMYRV